MTLENLPEWFPTKPAIYNIQKTYLENAESGPFFEGEFPERIFPPKEKWIKFLDFDLASPIGIPAGPLLNSKWVDFAAKFGFDVLTYKTIRSYEHSAHPLPNVIYVDTQGMVTSQKIPKRAISRPMPDRIEELSITNSFGNPSRSPEYLMKDIEKANRSLQKGQILIVSIFGSHRPHIELEQDFLSAARLAKEAGAKIIEANFSCPNVTKSEGMLYMSSESVFKLASVLVKELRPIPLIIKTGYFLNKEQMHDVFVSAARAGVRAICGINTISMEVVDDKGKPALNSNRLTSGICGATIKEVALAYIREAKSINTKEKLDLTILGCGGIVLPEHFDEFLDAGANIAMTATGMMWDPYLAARFHLMKQEVL
ncbi:MAG: dihydroorotate dehydrogenase [Chlamydiae bacterium]|nr:dihydroorotate dehydrogenase [Chlamydiota bacterium]